MAKELEKNYNPAEIEPRLYEKTDKRQSIQARRSMRRKNTTSCRISMHERN
mgnify:CR=1 FL=1